MKPFAPPAGTNIALIAALACAGNASAQADGEPAAVSVTDAASVAELEYQAFDLLYQSGEAGMTGTALRRLEAAVNAGSAPAANELSLAYLFGRGVAADLDQGMRLERIAAEAGNAPAQFRLGLRYLPGGELDVDMTEARQWFEAAGAQGYGRALYALATTYVNEDEAAARLDSIFELVSRSAALGEPSALLQLGRILLTDERRRDPDRGIALLELAAATMPELAAEVGMLYLRGTRVERDPARAARWLAEAESRGDPGAKLWLSVLLQRGAGIARDEARAASLQREYIDSATAGQKNNMAWQLSVHPDPFLRDGAFAVRLMESIAGNPEDLSPPHRDTLAAAYAETGRFDDAIALQQRIVAELSVSAEGLLEEGGYRERLELYRAGAAYRQPE